MRILFSLLAACLAVLLFSPHALGGPIKEGSLTGLSNGTTVQLRWLSEDESNVVRIEIERSSGSEGQFLRIQQIAPKGSNAAYEYIDDSAFRLTGSVFRYQIRAVFSNGSSVSCAPITVRHAVSNVRRTWGSIKAMFR